MIEAVAIKASGIGGHPLAAAEFCPGITWGIVALQLPLPRHARAVSRLLHEVPDSLCLGIQDSKRPPVAVVVAARHQLHASARAERLCVGMAKSHTVLRQAIDGWSGVTRPPITPDSLNTEIISYDQHDVWTLVTPYRSRAAQKPEHHEAHLSTPVLRHHIPQKAYGLNKASMMSGIPVPINFPARHGTGSTQADCGFN